jgi:hypothetical protein
VSGLQLAGLGVRVIGRHGGASGRVAVCPIMT